MGCNGVDVIKTAGLKRGKWQMGQMGLTAPFSGAGRDLTEPHGGHALAVLHIR
jgi:hypothetical protein